MLNMNGLTGLLILGLGCLDLAEKCLWITALAHGLPDPRQEIGAVLLRLRKTIKHNGNSPQGETRGDSKSHVEVLNSPEHQKTKPRRSHDCSDANHGDRQHEGLVESGHDRRLGQRKLNISQDAKFGRTVGPAGLHHILGNMSDSQIHHSYQGRKCIDHGHHGGRDNADAEEEHKRNHVDEGVHRLHGVQNRSDHIPCRIHSGADDPQWYPDESAEPNGYEHHANGAHGLQPVHGAEKATHDQTCSRHEADLGCAN